MHYGATKIARRGYEPCPPLPRRGVDVRFGSRRFDRVPLTSGLTPQEDAIGAVSVLSKMGTPLLLTQNLLHGLHNRLFGILFLLAEAV